MTTPIVQSISDEQLAELDELTAKLAGEDWWVDWGGSYAVTVSPSNIQSLIARLRAAEADVERLNKLDALCEAYGFEGIHEGNRWMIDGPYRDIRAAIDGIKPAMEHTP
ncbi:TPA: hypothetical protein ACWMC5_005915 [Pseudomonas aeruginosa]